MNRAGERWDVPIPPDRAELDEQRAADAVLAAELRGALDALDALDTPAPAPSSAPASRLVLDGGRVLALGACGHWWQEPVGGHGPGRCPFAGEVVRLVAWDEAGAGGSAGGVAGVTTRPGNHPNG